MKNGAKRVTKVTAVLLALMLVITSVQFSFGLIGFAAAYDFETILAQSNFPVININIENGEAPDKVNKDNKKNATFEIKNTNGKGKDLTISTKTEVVDGVETTVWPMTIKGRGNSSWTMPTGKKPYNIKFSSKQDILGMGKNKSWSLLANWLDTSFVRNYMAYKMGKELNTNAMDCEIVELCINGKYEGLYLLTEKYGLGDTRIVTAGDGSDVDGDGEISQFLVEADSRAVSNNEPNRFETSSGIYFVVKEPDEDDITSATDPRFLHVQELVKKADEAIMNGGNYEDYIDVESFIDVYIIEELTKNPDFGYGYQPCYSSTFLNAEEGGKLYSGTIWDFDIAMGRNDYANQAAEGNRDTLSPTGLLHSNTKWIKELFERPEFVQKVKERWTEVHTILENKVLSLLPETINLVRPSAAWDFATWEAPSARNTGWNYRTPLDFEGESAHVTNFLTKRIEWLNEQWLVDETSNSYDLTWSRSDADSEVWDGGYGVVETSGTNEKVYGTQQGNVSDAVELPISYTLTGPNGNTKTWWIDGSATGGFGGWANSMTATTSGRYIYATDTKGWWFQQGTTYTMGQNGAQIYVVDIAPNGSVTLHDGAVTPSATSRDVTITNTNYGYLTVSGNTITVSYKADQKGNTGTTIGGSGSSQLKLSYDSSCDGTLKAVNRPADSKYASVPVSTESTYIYYEGVKPTKWTVTNKATGAVDNGEIVIFDEETRKVTSKGTGTVVITATAADGTKASIEISSKATTAAEAPTAADSRYGKYYTEVQGISSEKGNWATYAGGTTTFTANVKIDAADYNSAKTFSLATKTHEEIIGGAGTYYVYVNGAPFFKATSGSDPLNRAGFDSSNTLTIADDNDTISTYARYSYMNGMHAHTDAVMNNLKSLLTAGNNTIEIVAYSENGGAMVRPYLTSKNSVGEVEDVPVTGISFTASADKIVVGDSAKFAAAVTPANATNYTITWASSNDKILTVDANGNVKAVAVGSADITATSNGFSVTKTVTVLPKSVESVTVDPSEVTLTVGETATVKVTVLPADATDKTVTVKSNSNSAVADFDITTGVITAKAVGTTAITLKSGEKTAVINVTVEKGFVAVESVSVSDSAIAIKEGESKTVTATVAPEDATVKDVAWSTSNAKVATVKDGVITAVKAGTAVITVTADGGKTAEVKVTVNKLDAVVAINGGAASVEVKDLASVKLTADVTPANVSDKSVTWSVDDTSVATINANGVVTAKKPGTVTVTATSNYDTAKNDTIIVIVTLADVSVEITNKTAITMDDESLTLTATVTPNVYDKSVVWTVENGTGEATVEGNVLTPVKAGTVTVTATSVYDSTKSASVEINIAAGFVAVESVSVSDSAIAITEGESATVTATVSPEDATVKDVTWSTSDSAVATVKDGVITAVKAGTAVITVTADGGKTAEVKVTVNKIDAAVAINGGAESVEVKDLASVKLTADVTPANVSDKSVTWSVNDTSVATVDANGVVTAKKPGEAVVTATSNYDNTKSDTIKVIVTKTDVSVSIAGAKDITMDDASLTLTATVTPNVYDKSVVWTVDNTSIATIKNGVLTPAAVGKVTVTATSVYDSTKSASVEISIAAGFVAVESVSVSDSAIAITEGESKTVTATVAPENATNKAVAWSTSDSAVATVKDGVITAVKAGTAVITVTADGGKTAKVKVTVNKINATVAINGGAASITIKDLEKATLTADVTPANVSDKSVTWSIDDTSIATINASGVVTAKKPGTVTVTATSKYDTTKSDTIIVIVTMADVTVTISGTDSMTEGTEATFTAKVAPAVYDTSVVWSTSDSAVATVQNGVVKALKAGKVTITATSVYDSTKSASVDVTVSEKPSGITIYAPAYDASHGAYPAGSVVYNPADGKYYVYTNAWGLSTTSFPSGWTEVKTNLAGGIPSSDSAFSFDVGQIVKKGDKYYTPLGNGYWSMWIADGANNAYWNMVPAEFAQYFETGTTYAK